MHHAFSVATCGVEPSAGACAIGAVFSVLGAFWPMGLAVPREGGSL